MVFSRQHIFGQQRPEPLLPDYITDPMIPPVERERRSALYFEKLIGEQAGLEREMADCEARIGVSKKLREWAAGSPKLERNDCSRLHQLIQAFADGKIMSTNKVGRDDWKAFSQDNHAFVVQHDWASAFKGAQDFDGGEFRWPYDICSFEFRLSGKTVIAVCFQDPKKELLKETNGIGCILFYEQDGYWVTFGEKDRTSMQGMYLWDHLRAIAIALEAEVAVHEVVRAPHAANKKRVEAGKVPMNDFHVVSLARRARGKPLQAAAGDVNGSRRLHFRRGHWRHFETHKTWIKWMLVGNPDLGFIAKEYRL